MTKYDKLWNMKYEQLVEYKRKKGNCMVPHRYEQNKSLGKWVSHQQESHANNKIRLDRKDILDTIGFAWKDNGALTFKPDIKLWYQQCEKLIKYKRKNGHCTVPRKYEQDKYLGMWVSTQRARQASNKIPIDRKRILDRIGFVWKPDRYYNFKPDDKLWHQQYEKLLEYKRKNGHCKVPKHKDDKSLGIWVINQRARHANNKMRPDRKKLLDALDFVWKADPLATRSPITDVRGVAI
jgi:hypothetical protein